MNRSSSRFGLTLGILLAISPQISVGVAADPEPESSELKPSDPVAGRTHWAFQPLVRPRVPAVRNVSWPRSEIDRFVLRKLELADLQPSPDADRRALLRRVSFQLIGLPPTPEQMREFVEDENPQAFERMADRLLASPQFGERWGRHWLDLARYADSNGLDENFLFREAWRYRNWVIDAINEDLPFDRFLTEQIAGDLLPHESIEQRDRQRIAAGFLVLGPKVLLGNNPNNQRMEVADEQLDTVGRAVLGQTIGCARCHDHKFDPVPTADYYALAGILTSTQVTERRYMLGQQRVMEKLVGLGADGDARNSDYEAYWRERASRQTRLDRAKKALAHLEKGESKAFENVRKQQANAVADGAANSKLSKEQRIDAQRALVASCQKAAKPRAIPPRAMIPKDVSKPADEHIRIAGQFDKKGDRVTRGFLRVLSDRPVEIPAGRSGRIELSEWLSDVDGGAGRLAARVLANRVWYHLVGLGLVRTVDNFGRTGEAPSHRELLDYLAVELIASDWSVKSLVRKIVMSRVFALSSQHDPHAHELDPENRLLWRAHRRRLDPESLRDGMLAISGELDFKPMDSSVWYLGDQATAVGANTNRRRVDFPCRSVYLPVIRNDLPEIFQAFDFADPHAATGMRPRTTAATQSLFVMNDDSVRKAAESLARRLIAESRDGEERARLLFERVFQAPGGEIERESVLAFVRTTEQSFKGGDANPELRAWALACHALFASTRFQLLE